MDNRAANRSLAFVLLSVTFILIWLTVRWPAIRGNTFSWDDYVIPAQAFQAYVGSYRPLVYIEYVAIESVVPNHFWTRLPKFLGCAYLAIASAGLVLLLTKWGMGSPVAFLIAAVVLCHPILADVGLWSSLHAIGLSLALVTFGYSVWGDLSNRRNAIFGTLLILLGVLGYQIYIAIPLLFLVSEPLVKQATGRSWSLSIQFRKLILLILVSAADVAQMQVLRSVVDGPDKRGFVSPGPFQEYLLTKFHGAFNLIVNAIVPVEAFYFGIQRSWSAWKWVPIAIAVTTMVVGIARRSRTRDVVAWSLSPFVLLAIPALPSFIMSQSPYAWRVSVPAVVAVALSLAPVAILLSRTRNGSMVAVGVLVVLVLVIVPVARYEARLREGAFEADGRVMDAASEFWNTQGVGHGGFLLLVDFDRIRDTARGERHGAHDLSVGYSRVDPLDYSVFMDSWVGQHFVTDYRGFRLGSCDRSRESCQQLFATASLHGHRDIAGWLTFHDRARRLTVISR